MRAIHEMGHRCWEIIFKALLDSPLISISFVGWSRTAIISLWTSSVNRSSSTLALCRSALSLCISTKSWKSGWSKAHCFHLDPGTCFELGVKNLQFFIRDNLFHLVVFYFETAEYTRGTDLLTAQSGFASVK